MIYRIVASSLAMSYLSQGDIEALHFANNTMFKDTGVARAEESSSKKTLYIWWRTNDELTA